MPKKVKKKILLVDGDKLLQKYLCQLLEKNNFDVVCATSYPEALERLNVQTVDMCIIDLALPGKAGLELLQTMRQDERFKKLPVVIQSGIGDRYIKKALALAPLEIFRKPLPMDDLLHVIQQHLA